MGKSSSWDYQTNRNSYELGPFKKLNNCAFLQKKKKKKGSSKSHDNPFLMLQTEIFHAAWPPLQNRLGTSVQCQMPACSLWTEAMVPASQQVNRSHSTSEVLMIRAGCSPTKKKIMAVQGKCVYEGRGVWSGSQSNKGTTFFFKTLSALQLLLPIPSNYEFLFLILNMVIIIYRISASHIVTY